MLSQKLVLNKKYFKYRAEKLHEYLHIILFALKCKIYNLSVLRRWLFAQDLHHIVAVY